jgi:BMFP domain-containing protein YqiC
MIETAKIDSLIKQILSHLPADLHQAKQDIEKNLRAAMQKTFTKMELVTREEFDVQAELLSRTRAALEELEKKLAEIEKSVNDQK